MIDIGFAGALLGGVLSLLSPCSVMLLPAFFATAFADPRTLVLRAGLFTAGLMTTLVPLGLFAGVVGALLLQHRGALIAAASMLL
ncbi:MAG: cytochrome c biogenesis protein CcdA, partial [Microbacteriaceae bacterium]|nr:cytochrome c biogenesis protein CcdA [Microbacteriaceae bacterium]